MIQAKQVYSHLQQMPASMLPQVFDFISVLEVKKTPSEPRQPGSARGQISIADDFDAPLNDFDQYQ